MDLQKSSLEEKISKLAEHGESLKRVESTDKIPTLKEGRVEGEKKEQKSEKGEIATGASVSSKATSQQTQAVTKTAKDLKNLDKTNQIKSLVDLSFTKGIFFAIEVAQKMDDPYLLDELHDNLIRQFKDLIKSGKLKEI